MAIIADVFNSVDNLITTFVTGGYSTLASQVRPAVWAAFTLYIMIIGIGYLRQSYHITFSDLAIRLTRGAIVLTLALNWGTFSTWAYNGLFGVLNNLGSTMVAGITGAVSTNGNTIEAGFIKLLEGITTLVSATLLPPGFPSISRIASAICLLVGGTLLYGAAIFVMLFAKVAFAITVVLAPVFIPFAMFDSTRDVFGAWARSVGGFTIIPALATCVLAFQLGVMNGQLNRAATGDVNLADAATTLLMCVAFFLIMKQVPSIGGGMVGTPVTAGGSAMAELFMKPLTKALSNATTKGAASMGRNARSAGVAAAASMKAGALAAPAYIASGAGYLARSTARMIGKARAASANRRASPNTKDSMG